MSMTMNPASALCPRATAWRGIAHKINRHRRARQSAAGRIVLPSSPKAKGGEDDNMAGRAISRLLLAGAVLLAAGWNAPARADATLTMNVVMPRASSFFVGVYKPWADAV